MWSVAWVQGRRIKGNRLSVKIFPFFIFIPPLPISRSAENCGLAGICSDWLTDSFLSAAYKALRKLHDLWVGTLQCIGDVHGHIMFFFKPFIFVLTTDCLVQCKKNVIPQVGKVSVKKGNSSRLCISVLFRRFLSSAPLSVNRYLENIHMMLLGSGSRRSGRISVQSKNVSLRTKALSVWQIKNHTCESGCFAFFSRPLDYLDVFRSFSANQVPTFALVTHPNKLRVPPEAHVSAAQSRLPLTLLFLLVAMRQHPVGCTLAMFNANTHNPVSRQSNMMALVPIYKNIWKFIWKARICGPEFLPLEIKLCTQFYYLLSDCSWCSFTV